MPSFQNDISISFVMMANQQQALPYVTVSLFHRWSIPMKSAVLTEKKRKGDLNQGKLGFTEKFKKSTTQRSQTIYSRAGEVFHTIKGTWVPTKT